MPSVARAPFHVVVVGAGFAGSLTTVGLVDAWSAPRPLRITLLERSGVYGPGVAYATTDDQHLLNVAARSMSALRDRPGQLVAWTGGSDQDYVPRARYGDYLRELLADAERRAGPGVVTRRTEEAVAIAGDAVHTLQGGHHPADAVVLATGISRPAPLPGARPGLDGHPGYLADPWAPGRLEALRGAGRVLIVGTGLTMADIALTLGRDADGPELVAVSRNGLVPRAHRARAVVPLSPVVRPQDGPWTADRLAAEVAAAAAAARDWRAAIDSLRPVSQGLWRALAPAERARFARTHARRWEVHRHRMAPEVAARLRALRHAGRLRIRAASIADVGPATDDPRRLSATLDGEPHVFDAVVNATGPDLDVRRGGDPLLGGLLDAGRATAGPLGLGLRTDADGALVRADGGTDAALFALGALRRGELWETTAVPEIRCQCADVAAVIAHRAAAAADAEAAEEAA